MPTLRIEVTLTTQTSGSTSSIAFDSYAEAAAYGGGAPSAMDVIGWIMFTKQTLDGKIDGVSIDADTTYIFKDWVDAWIVSGESATIFTDTVDGEGTLVAEIDVSTAVFSAMQECDYVLYNASTPGWANNLGIEFIDDSGQPLYVVTYNFVTATDVNVRGRLLGGSPTLFDSSESTSSPYPDIWSRYASPLVWGPTPDIFWTQRILCEETPS